MQIDNLALKPSQRLQTTVLIVGWPCQFQFKFLKRFVSQQTFPRRAYCFKMLRGTYDQILCIFNVHAISASYSCISRIAVSTYRMRVEHDKCIHPSILLHKPHNFIQRPSLCLLVAASETKRFIISISHRDRSRNQTDPPCYLYMCTVQAPVTPSVDHLPVPLAEVLCLSTSIAYACENVDVAVA